MWKKYEKIHLSNPKIAKDINQSRELFDLVKIDLSEEELSTIQTSLTISPSFLHLNSFMYEPLIDVGGEKIVETSQKLLNLNQKFK